MEKNEWRKWLADYFSFSRKERWAVMALVVVMAGLVVMPHFVRDAEPQLVVEDSLALAVIKSWQHDSLTGHASLKYRQDTGESKYHNYRDSRAREVFSASGKLFHFDPNRATPNEWMRLGVKEKTAMTIARFLEKGGRFRNADDLNKIYGLPAALAGKLKPYVRIDNPQAGSKPAVENYQPGKDRETKKININKADSVSLVALPGIGPKLAARIVGYREKLGGFYKTGQLLEVYGIKDSLFIALQPFLESDIGVPDRIDINSAPKEELIRHPYFRGPISATIITYREAHGAFLSVDDLGKIHLADSAWIKKVGPYCKFR